MALPSGDELTELEARQDPRLLRALDTVAPGTPLREGIDNIEDPLADEVLRAGEIVPGTTVLVDRDESGDDEDRPLGLKLVKPRKKPVRKKEPAGVGGRGGDSSETPIDDDAPDPGDAEAAAE